MSLGATKQAPFLVRGSEMALAKQGWSSVVSRSGIGKQDFCFYPILNFLQDCK